MDGNSRGKTFPWILGREVLKNKILKAKTKTILLRKKNKRHLARLKQLHKELSHKVRDKKTTIIKNEERFVNTAEY